ncbi:MAG TPA: PAS domain S-box protein [Vicinamibacterales bacterium]
MRLNTSATSRQEVRSACVANRAADVTELRRLQLAIEASGEIIFTTDANGTFTYVNPEFERVYGYLSREVVGCATPRVLKSGTTESDDYASFWTQLKEKQVVRRDFVNRTKTGVRRHIETSANPIVSNAGDLVGFLAVQRDVTARKQLETALRESEHRCRTLADAAQDSIFIVNRAGRIEYANTVSAARFGLSSADVVGKRLDGVFSKTTAAEMWREVSTVFETGRRQLVEQRFESPTGELWLETWLVPVETEGGEVQSIMGIARDVTERKSLERQFLQAQKMEAVGRLAGGIAHDFNNLLTAILGYCELLRDRVPDASDALADIHEIRTAGERASRLTRQLLAFSRKQPMMRQTVDLNALIADVHRMLGRLLGEDIDLSVTAAPDLWPVIADPGQVEQVLLNLAVNARDAMPKGGRLAIATANVQLDDAFVQRRPGAVAGPYVSVTVQDTGCGMTSEVLTHAFEPFFTTKSQGKGTGLGLSTVYGIVKHNGGYITIDSEPAVGTVVTVLWPKGKSDGDGSSARSETPVERPLGGSETILLVEDDPGIRALMRKSLEPYGYHVIEAHDVSQAMAIAATGNGQIDLLLSDVIMPGLHGPDLAQRIVADRPRIKTLYVSGFPGSHLLEPKGSCQRIAYLAKPFTPQALAMKVRECLDA